MKKYNVRILSKENFEILVDCELIAKDENEAVQKTYNYFKYTLYSLTKGEIENTITNVNEI